MNIYFHPEFYEEYTVDPAAETGRMEAIVEALPPFAELVQCEPATERDILEAHSQTHVEHIKRMGLYDMAALAAGGAIGAARQALEEPSFGLIRPPGHHASGNSCWGFCFFNNMAVSLYHLRAAERIEEAFVLDFDLHHGDGNVNILGHEPWVEILNPDSAGRDEYLDEVSDALQATSADIIAVSAGFDLHVNDWGGLLYSEDYKLMGNWVRSTALGNGGGCYGILEGGYNHSVLGRNVCEFLEGLNGDS
jgi:acetoin utilization deacetylase AcuC-like enzyme